MRANEWEAFGGASARREGPLSFRAAFGRILRAVDGRRRGGAATPAAPTDAHSRRVVVKARVVQVGSDWGKKRRRCTSATSSGRGFSAPAPLERCTARTVRWCAPSSSRSSQVRAPFRIVLSPKDGHALDLEEYVRGYMERLEADLRQKLRWATVNL
jgi:hypothetical protein